MKLLFILLLAVSPLLSYEMEEDYAIALHKAKIAHKPLLTYLYMLNCRTCNYMNNNVFTDPKVMDYLDQHYVVAHLYTKDKSLPIDLRTKMSPTFHFIDSQNGEMLESIMGGRNPEKFLKLLTVSYAEYLEEHE